MDQIIKYIQRMGEVYQAGPQYSATPGLGATAKLMDGDGTRCALRVSVVWAGTPDNSYNVQIVSGTGANTYLIYVLQPSIRSVSLHICDYGDIIYSPIYVVAGGAAATVYGYSLRYRSPVG